MIEIILSIITTIMSIVAIAISVKTLKQNSIMIENSTRPYISIYGMQYDGTYVITIKNFGCSNAIITKFETDLDLSTVGLDETHVPFSHIENTTIAPKQSLKTNVNTELMPNIITFNIEYKSETNTYNEKISLNFAIEKDIILTKINSKIGKEYDRLKDISYAMQEFVKRYF